MTVDLKPRNRIHAYHSGSFSWGWMAERGVFLAAGCATVAHGSHKLVACQGDRGDIITNDGCHISASEARAMAWAAYGLWRVEVGKQEWWDAMSEEERKRREAQPWDMPNRDWTPIRKDFVDRALEFAWFAWASGGFRVY